MEFLLDGFKFGLPLYSIGSARRPHLWTVKLLRHPVGNVLPLFRREDLARRTIEALEFVGYGPLPLPSPEALAAMLARCREMRVAYATFNFCMRPGYTSERLVALEQITAAISDVWHALADPDGESFCRNQTGLK